MVKRILLATVIALGVIVTTLSVSKILHTTNIPLTEKTDYREFIDSLKFDSVEVDGLKIDTFTIDEGTFKVKTFVLLTDDTTIVKKITGWDEIGFTTGLTTEGFIWIADPYDRGLVAHELFHEAWLTLELSAVPINNKTDEVLAYEVGRLTNEFYKQWFNEQK